MEPWHCKTESEQVESIRKLVNRSKWVALFFVVAFFAFAAMLIRVWHLGFKAHELIVDVHGSIPEKMADSYPFQVLIGIPFGLLIGLLLIVALACLGNILDMRYGYKTERLMLKYHDKLKEKEKNFQQEN